MIRTNDIRIMYYVIITIYQMIETIEGSQGEIWFVVNGRTVMYIDSYGVLSVKGDVIAVNNNIPPPPTKENTQK